MRTSENARLLAKSDTGAPTPGTHSSHATLAVFLDGSHEPTAPGGIMRAGGMLATCFSLATATLGSGILAMPALMNDAGIVLSILLLIMTLLLSVYSVHVLVVLMDRSGIFDYSELANRIAGRAMGVITAICVGGMCFGATMVYTRLVGDTAQNLLAVIPNFPFTGVWGDRAVMALCWLVLMLPLSLPRNVNALRFASALGIVAAIWATFAVFLSLLMDRTTTFSTKLQGVSWFKWSLSAVSATPTMLFLFASQPNAIQIYRELKPRTNSRMTRASLFTFTGCTMLYIWMGFSGYVRFGSSIVAGNVLRNYQDPFEQWYMAIAFFGVILTLTMAYPLCIFPVRDAIATTFMGYIDPQDVPTATRMGVSTAIAVVSLLGAMFVPNVAVLFDILGGVFGSMVSFIIPAVLALRMGNWEKEVVGLGHVIGVWLLIVVGVIVGIAGTIIALMKNL